MKIQKCVYGICLALLASFAVSCNVFEGSENKAKLSQIRVGMTRAEVIKIMGEPPDEAFQEKNILFYFTDPKWRDGLITRDECTPFVFDEDEDILLGFGYEFYKQKYSLKDWSRRTK